MCGALVLLARFALAGVCAVAMACSQPARLAADLVVTRANVWTGEPGQPAATAIAIIGDRIVDAGGADAIERWRGPNTSVIDAEGRRVLPGFQEREKGTIARGKLADLVILTDDIFTIPALAIKDVRVLTTIAGGKVVYQRRP